MTAGTESWKFDTKAEAIAHVASLRRLGRSNIDVGCMQINLHHHPNPFATIERAFDPQANADYASRFLRGLYAEAGDWASAADNYHSRDPYRRQAYRDRVVEHWRILGGRAETLLAAPAPTSAPTPTSERAPVDHAWTERPNERFRAQRGSASPAQVSERADVRRRQLGAWREAQVRGAAVAHDATMRRAELTVARASKIDAAFRAEAHGFSANHSRQIQFWRARGGRSTLTAIPAAFARIPASRPDGWPRPRVICYV